VHSNCQDASKIYHTPPYKISQELIWLGWQHFLAILNCSLHHPVISHAYHTISLNKL